MSATTPSHTRRTSLLVVLGALGLVLSLFAGGAAAHRGGTATQIVVTSVSTPGIDVPSTPGAPESFIVRDVDFTVEVGLVGEDGVTPRPLSRKHDVPIVLSVVAGPDAPEELATGVVRAGETAAAFTGVRLPTAANGVVLRVAVGAYGARDVAPGDSAPFDVLESFQSAPASSTLTGIGPGGGVGASCEPTPAQPVCGDLVLPDPSGVLSNQLLALGPCDLADCDRSFVQALVALAPEVYTRDAPATLVMKCDKSSCQGEGVPSYTLSVSLTPADPPTTAQPCARKGKVDEGLELCVDYRQSHRSRAGDTYLYLLFVQDVRVRFP